MQSVIPVEGGQSLLKLTIASYWRPNGKNIQRGKASKEEDDWGVRPDPDCQVKMDDKQQEEWYDKRRARDVPPIPTADGTSPAPPAGTPLDFDPQLRRAVEVLEERLDRQPAQKRG